MKIQTKSPLAEKVAGFALDLAPSHFERVSEETKPEAPREPKSLSVSELQSELNEHFDAKLKVDNIMGPATENAVREAEKFLALVQDGKLDTDLIQALLSLKGCVKDITPDAVISGDTRKPDFQKLWDTMVIKPEKMPEVQFMAAKIVKNKARYEAVSKVTGVPWIVIGCIHKQESNCDFGTHLHNGDPLTARTVQVPAGRPVNGKPPFTWEESAIDALGYDGATGIKDWSIVATLNFLHRYNGLGYLNKGIYSPYLWSYTNHYVSGKYVRDGVYDPKAVSGQCGVAPLLKVLGYGEKEKLVG